MKGARRTVRREDWVPPVANENSYSFVTYLRSRPSIICTITEKLAKLNGSRELFPLIRRLKCQKMDVCHSYSSLHVHKPWCSGFRPFVINHFNTIVSNFQDWFRRIRIRMEPYGLRVGKPQTSAIVQLLAAQSFTKWGWMLSYFMKYVLQPLIIFTLA